MVSKPQVVIGVTGSIAAFKAAEVVSLFCKRGVGMSVIMTSEAEHFVTPLTLQALSGGKVYRQMFDVLDVWDMEHVSLAETARAVLVVPATANIIAKAACGICDDLLTCVLSATKAKVFMAPAMNDGMYTHPLVQENIKKLQGLGYEFIGPVTGALACGRQAIGRMSDVSDIVERVSEYLASNL